MMFVVPPSPSSMVVVDAVVGPGGLAWPVPPQTPPVVMREFSHPGKPVFSSSVAAPVVHPFSSSQYGDKGRAIGWNGPQPQVVYSGAQR